MGLIFNFDSKVRGQYVIYLRWDFFIVKAPEEGCLEKGGSEQGRLEQGMPCSNELPRPNLIFNHLEVVQGVLRILGIG